MRIAILIREYKRSNVIIGCIYRYPRVDINGFNDCYLNNCLDKVFEDNKSIFLLSDISVDLLSLVEIRQETILWTHFSSVHTEAIFSNSKKRELTQNMIEHGLLIFYSYICCLFKEKTVGQIFLF